MAENIVKIGTIADNPTVTDWAQHIEDLIDDTDDGLISSGSGDKTGVVLVEDAYPLKRQLDLDSRVFLQGSQRVSHHIGGCVGFYKDTANWTSGNDWLVKWKQAGEPSSIDYYSNFGAGADNIHFSGGGDLGGVFYQGAQQAAGLSNIYVRGFEGSSGTDARSGLKVFGDTWSGSGIFVDAGTGSSSTRTGCIGIDFSGYRAYSVNWRNFTVHNCGIGLKFQELFGCRFENFETEITDKPIVGTYNARAVTFDTCVFRHTDEVIDIQRTRWADDTMVHVNGYMADNSPGVVRVNNNNQNNAQVLSCPKTFDFVIEKRTGDATMWSNRRLV
mgnify:FL=1